MNVFNAYSNYYNTLYKDKDYSNETSFVLQILKKYNCSPKTILDLGCGTGLHAIEFFKNNIFVTGIDLSETMINIGREIIASSCLRDSPCPTPEISQGDLRNIELKKSFDAVISLFHVMSYQNSEEDALSMMLTAKKHLADSGLFLFDFWYGPGVLTDPPHIREKILEDENIKGLRTAKPLHKVNENIVEVHYDISFVDKITGEENTLNECHSMRYWFIPELKYLAKQAGFTFLSYGSWLSEALPEINTWNVWILLQPKT